MVWVEERRMRNVMARETEFGRGITARKITPGRWAKTIVWGEESVWLSWIHSKEGGNLL
jgi:hypothetical protein